MRTLRVSLAFALTLTVSAGLASGVALAGDPKTPLGKWMKPNMGALMAGADSDFGALQKNLDLVASKVPGPGDYGNWASIAKQGSAAAAKQDVTALKAACKSCHDQYKTQYIKDFPDKAWP